MIMNKVTDKSWLEKGFWYRSYDGNISQNEGERYQVNSEYVKTIADDVLELIEVDDLVGTPRREMLDKTFDERFFGVVESVDDIQICATGGCVIYRDDIEEIWTKTTSNHYTRQWTRKDGLKPSCIKL